MKYIGFKALLMNGGSLISPVTGKEWERREGTFVMRRQDEKGVFAGTWSEAERYPGKIYACSPFEPCGRIRGHLYSAGWEADAAMIVAGPFEKNEEGERDAARFVISAYAAGFREQVPRVLCWAAIKAKMNLDAQIARNISNDLTELPPAEQLECVAELALHGLEPELAVELIRKLTQSDIIFSPAFFHYCQKIFKAAVGMPEKQAKEIAEYLIGLDAAYFRTGANYGLGIAMIRGLKLDVDVTPELIREAKEARGEFNFLLEQALKERREAMK